MQYAEHVRSLPADYCPFCGEEIRSQIIREFAHWRLIANRAPYAPDHLMLIAREHIERIHEIAPEAWNEMRDITHLACKWFESRWHPGYTFFVRDESVYGSMKKSVKHLHVHLIPSCLIGRIEDRADTRDFLDDAAIDALTREIADSFPRA